MCTGKKILFLLSAFFSSFLLVTPSNAQTIPEVPAQYGEIVYRFNEKNPSQIFIIGIGHRDALTCRNGENTSRVQAEIYKIGDWLIHHQGVELVLPEGFFKNPSANIEKRISTLRKEEAAAHPYRWRSWKKGSPTTKSMSMRRCY